jgi:cyclic pyranopterin phosphate synthase
VPAQPLSPLAPDGQADPAALPLRDGQGRFITYLRLSVTDRCNYRCGYCTPPQAATAEDALSLEELVRLVEVFARLGVRRVRLTGGEPLLRSDIVELARRIKAIPRIAELAMTTNGHLLERLGPALLEAGVDKLNVSIDSLDPERFRTLTGGPGDLSRLVAGLDACLAAGFRDLKTNTVVMGGVNDSEVAGLIRFAWARGITPRFIELMPFSAQGKPVPTLELIEQLRAQGLPLSPEPVSAEKQVAGPSEYWLGDGGRVGFIGPLTRNFCSRCNRVRVAASGELRACLGGTQAVALAHLLRGPDAEARVEEAIREGLQCKPAGHQMAAPAAGARLLSIRSIGG